MVVKLFDADSTFGPQERPVGEMLVKLEWLIVCLMRRCTSTYFQQHPGSTASAFMSCLHSQNSHQNFVRKVPAIRYASCTSQWLQRGNLNCHSSTLAPLSLGALI